MINLGIVGLGPVWENRYRPVLEKLRHRVRVRAVYDPIASRCDQAAFDFGAVPYQGVSALVAQGDSGILVLDMSWHGNSLLQFVRKRESRPISPAAWGKTGTKSWSCGDWWSRRASW